MFSNIHSPFSLPGKLALDNGPSRVTPLYHKGRIMPSIDADFGASHSHSLRCFGHHHITVELIRLREDLMLRLGGRPSKDTLTRPPTSSLRGPPAMLESLLHHPGFTYRPVPAECSP